MQSNQQSAIVSMFKQAVIEYNTPFHFDFDGTQKAKSKGKCEALKSVLSDVLGLDKEFIALVISEAINEAKELK